MGPPRSTSSSKSTSTTKGGTSLLCSLRRNKKIRKNIRLSTNLNNILVGDVRIVGCSIWWSDAGSS